MPLHLAIALAACTMDAPHFTPSEIDTSGGLYSPARFTGHIDHSAVREASGLARSGKHQDRLWVLNDSGSSAALHAVSLNGAYQQTSKLSGVRNRDWEDLASFHHDGKDWLLVADVGDNNASRRYVTLYVLEEPEPGSAVTAARELRIAYPDGPQDCEAVAVDTAGETILLLSKRSIPAVLYAVPLWAAASDAPLLAERLGPVASIPQPGETDLQRAVPDKSWHWQPTAMDISSDGRQAVILTYRSAYVFGRSAEETWFAAMQRQPLRLDLSDLRLAESVAFSVDGSAIYVTAEGRSPPLIRFDRIPGTGK